MELYNCKHHFDMTVDYNLSLHGTFLRLLQNLCGWALERWTLAIHMVEGAMVVQLDVSHVHYAEASELR